MPGYVVKHIGFGYGGSLKTGDGSDDCSVGGHTSADRIRGFLKWMELHAFIVHM